MNQQGEPYILLTETLLFPNYYYGLFWALLRLVVPNTERGVLERIVEPPL